MKIVTDRRFDFKHFFPRSKAHKYHCKARSPDEAREWVTFLHHFRDDRFSLATEEDSTSNMSEAIKVIVKGPLVIKPVEYVQETRLIDLSEEFMLQILCYLPLADLYNMFQVCKSMSHFSKLESFWKQWITNFYELPITDNDLQFIEFSWKQMCQFPYLEQYPKNMRLALIGNFESGTGKGVKIIGNAKFVGEFKDGYYHGRGIFSVGKERYKGMFKQGKCHGKGLYTNSIDGGRKEGEWRNGRFRKGKLIDTDGDTWEGAFKHGELEGTGTLIDRFGNTYVGDWKAGKCHGEGIFALKNKVNYKGRFHNGKPTGFGTFDNKTRQVYGQWDEVTNNFIKTAS